MTDKDILCFLASEGHSETPDSRFGWNVVGLFDNMPRRRMHLEVWGMNLEEFEEGREEGRAEAAGELKDKDVRIVTLEKENSEQAGRIKELESRVAELEAQVVLVLRWRVHLAREQQRRYKHG